MAEPHRLTIESNEIFIRTMWKEFQNRSERSPYQAELHSRLKSGRWGKDGPNFAWVSYFGISPLLDEKGHIAKWFVTATDI